MNQPSEQTGRPQVPAPSDALALVRGLEAEGEAQAGGQE